MILHFRLEWENVRAWPEGLRLDSGLLPGSEDEMYALARQWARKKVAERREAQGQETLTATLSVVGGGRIDY